MVKKSKGKGYSTDLTLGWVTEDLGVDWLQWANYGADWLSSMKRGTDLALRAIHRFLNYLKEKAPYASDVALTFRGNKCGHIVSSEEFNSFLIASGSNAHNSTYIKYMVSFLDYVISNNFLISDDEGREQPLFKNPLNVIQSTHKAKNETVHSPLPFRYIERLRHIICPYPKGKNAWKKCNFQDWCWAIDNLQSGNSGWVEVSPEVIDPNDPDCVSRSRTIKRNKENVEIHEIWSPVIAMLIFTKLHLPLRSFQVRFLDSGEGDTWRYENGQWVENTKHLFRNGTPKRPYEKGVFRRIYDSILESYSTGIFIATNKTADQNKDETQRGYVIPWQHEELLYWLEKLRNWQEKYNPINKLINGSELKKTHTKNLKSEASLKEMGDFAFLFREANSFFPIADIAIHSPWYNLLAKLEEDLFLAGETLSNGDRLRLVKDYSDDSKTHRSQYKATEFPLHSLRVSLITSYTMDTDMPLPVISKLLAGHSRLLMTIYYNKITPSVMAEKMKEANATLVKKGDESLRSFLVDAELNQIQLRAAYQKDQYNSVESALDSRNPVGWEERPTGICLVGGNSVRSDQLSTLAGCWNGGPIIKDVANPQQRIYGPVPHGPENCIRCRWHISDASYLPVLNSKFNQLSYKAHQAASLAAELEGELDTLKDELFTAEEKGEPFVKHDQLQALERRYEKQRVEADEYAKDYIATFNLINRVIQIENQRDGEDEGQKLIAVGSSDDIEVSMKFIETESELLHLALLCEDAEFYPDLHDDLRKTPAIAKRTNALSRMMARSGYQPIFLEMDENTQLMVGNALIRKMALIADPNDKMEGYRIATNYIEAQEYMTNSGLLDSSLEAVKNISPITLSSGSSKRIPLTEVSE